MVFNKGWYRPVIETFGLSQLYTSWGYSSRPVAAYKIRLFVFSSKISQCIFVKIYCENAEFERNKLNFRERRLTQIPLDF